MMDMLPFLRTVEKQPEKRIEEIVNYLIQFKETLEFALTNISIDNLSPDLVNKLNDLGANIEKNKEDREDEVAQITNKALTVSDVCNSDIFKSAVASEVESATTFTVNFETGHLEYAKL